MSESWLVWGHGGHGKVVADLIGITGNQCAGFADRSPEGPGVASESELRAALSNQTSLPLGATRIALGIGDNYTRLAVFREIPSDLMPALIHPTAWISETSVIGHGTVVLPGVVVHTDAHVGSAVILNTRAVVEHDCRIGDGVHISPGAVLTGSVSVGPGAWIGAGAVVLPGLKIGAEAIVGAGAVVIRDVPARVTVAGNPAVKIDDRRSEGHLA